MYVTDTNKEDHYLSFKVFHELMAKRVREILLISSPYDAFIIEEDGRLAERIIHEYRGLNLSQPPRITWVSSARAAFQALDEKQFDLVITMPRLDDMDPYSFGRKFKSQFPERPLFLLAHNTSLSCLQQEYERTAFFDRLFIWKGNTDLILAGIKSVEDLLNVSNDTQKARVRVIILVEDSPEYQSSLLPLMYKEIVLQTQAVMEESLNEEDRILRMRARPKILLAENYEETEVLYKQFKPYLLSVISDVRFQREQKVDDRAGINLLTRIKAQSPGVPLLVLSTEEAHRQEVTGIPASFINKNSPSLHTDIRAFLTQYLAFGDFIFRLPNGQEVARASNLRDMEKILPSVPDASVLYHAESDHFSTWLMARSEIQLASKLRSEKASDFSDTQQIKEFLVENIRNTRRSRRKGIVTDFITEDFDADFEFVKIGKGSLGGKARGLAFFSSQLNNNPEFHERYTGVTVSVPKTLVITTDGFDDFVGENGLKVLAESELNDAEIINRFLVPQLPGWLHNDLMAFLFHVDYPLAIRSSSLLEDAQDQPYAGIYRTYMIPNNHPDLKVRLAQLEQAIKLVYASTYLETPRSFAKSILHRIEEEKMAVVVQQVAGRRYDDFFYPHLSGVAQSYNFYPVSYMKPDEGIAHIALGLGKTVVEGEQALRFSPKYPQFLPQFSNVDDILKNAQKKFYVLNMAGFPDDLGASQSSTLRQLEINDDQRNIISHHPVRKLSSTYIPSEHRIRDSVQTDGQLVLTFASILKYKSFPLPEIIDEILSMGRKGMGSPVEIEFAVNLPVKERENPEFALLQIRPMTLQRRNMEVHIDEKEIARAFGYSKRAMGNGIFNDISDIIYVKPEQFEPARVHEISTEIGRINRMLVREKRRYLLVGPGRWGTADRFLGIPVSWNDISGVGAIIETTTEKFQADPSYGSHFFHNITSLGISYITIDDKTDDFLDESWLNSLPVAEETLFLKHLTLNASITIKIDGMTSKAVLLKQEV